MLGILLILLFSLYTYTEPDKIELLSKKDTAVAISSKRWHAYAYIKKTVESEIADRTAFKDQENSIYLPYRRLRFFYGEYDWYCKDMKQALRAKESTFRRAFDEVRDKFEKEYGKKIKFNGGKGMNTWYYYITFIY